MKRTLHISISLVLLVLAALPAAPVQAKRSWTVTVGGATKDFSVVTNTFQPRNIEIAVGDTVIWKFQEVHTVTFLSRQRPRTPFVLAGEKLIANPQVFFPAGERTYDGAGYRNSGTPPLDPVVLRRFRYSLTFTRQGTYEYQCLLHGPAMSGTVVVKDRVATSSAVFIRQARIEQTASLNAGQVAWTKLTPQRQGDTVVVALVGDSDNGYSIYRFTREPLVIKRGSTVTWQVRDPFEIHTVTFTSGQKPPDFLVTEPQQQGPTKLLLQAKAVNPTQTKAYDGTGYVNSGMLFPPGTPGNPPSSFSLTFTKPGRYTYVCLVRSVPEGMRGTIIVK